MKTFFFKPRWAMFLLLVLAALGLSACASTEDTDNASERPWNAPMGWENGLPNDMMQGH
ncbi:MAG TPA: hypothetical protein VG146_19835 [Verrucomicrobiae bacterium]|nr:hypothetical protein [Verrucomicrobiae bacterium]